MTKPKKPRGYHHIHGSIFKGSKQILVIVEVQCPKTLRDEVADAIVEYLQKRK